MFLLYWTVRKQDIFVNFGTVAVKAQYPVRMQRFAIYGPLHSSAGRSSYQYVIFHFHGEMNSVENVTDFCLFSRHRSA